MGHEGLTYRRACGGQPAGQGESACSSPSLLSRPLLPHPWGKAGTNVSEGPGDRVAFPGLCGGLSQGWDFPPPCSWGPSQQSWPSPSPQEHVGTVCAWARAASGFLISDPQLCREGAGLFQKSVDGQEVSATHSMLPIGAGLWSAGQPGNVTFIQVSSVA